MNHLDAEQQQHALYADSAARRGADRNDLRANRGVLFQTLALEASFVRAMYHVGLDPDRVKVLDVGCGAGGNWYQFVRLGVQPRNITGLDLQRDRLAKARDVYPDATLVHGNAEAMDFPNDSFDIVFESTMFSTLPDVALRARIAAEMVRVCRHSGRLILADWRISKFGDPSLRGLSRKELQSLFAIGRTTRLEGAFKGALVPPVGRFLSKRFPWAYFLVAACFPPLVGQVAYLLRKEVGQD